MKKAPHTEQKGQDQQRTWKGQDEQRTQKGQEEQRTQTGQEEQRIQKGQAGQGIVKLMLRGLTKIQLSYTALLNMLSTEG